MSCTSSTVSPSDCTEGGRGIGLDTGENLREGWRLGLAKTDGQSCHAALTVVLPSQFLLLIATLTLEAGPTTKAKGVSSKRGRKVCFRTGDLCSLGLSSTVISAKQSSQKEGQDRRLAWRDGDLAGK